MSTSQTQVVRPRWRRRAVAWIVPCRIGRRKLVWLERPWAVCPAGWTARQVANEQIDSAIEAFVALGLPVNVLLRPGAPPIERLAELGVARISLGHFLHAEMEAALTERLKELPLGASGPQF